MGKKEKIFRIITGDSEQNEYARLFLENGVMAVGWGKTGNIKGLSKDDVRKCVEKDRRERKETRPKPVEITLETKSLLMFRDEIKIGSPVIAYKPPETIVAIGRVTGEYDYNDKDELGRMDDTGYGYPHRRKVDWEVVNISKEILPDNIKKVISHPGMTGTLIHFDYDYENIAKILKRVAEEQKKTLEAEDEKQIVDYLRESIEELEKNLKLFPAPKISVGNIDLFGKKDDYFVVIEVKKEAGDSVIGQILGYIQGVKELKSTDKVRGIIVAENVTERVKKAVTEIKNLSIYICKLKFEFLNLRG